MALDLTRLFVQESDVPAYEPRGHSGTSNRRLFGADSGATHLEALIGTIQPGQGATPHYHPGIDQFCYLLEGEAEVEIGGVTRHLSAGCACLFPANLRHTFTALGNKPVRVLIVYGPPYGEGARVDV